MNNSYDAVPGEDVVVSYFGKLLTGRVTTMRFLAGSPIWTVKLDYPRTINGIVRESVLISNPLHFCDTTAVDYHSF